MTEYLHAKNIFAFMPLEQGPLRLLALQKVGAHGHLSTGDVRSKALAHATEGQVSTLHRGTALSAH